MKLRFGIVVIYVAVLFISFVCGWVSVELTNADEDELVKTVSNVFYENEVHADIFDGFTEFALGGDVIVKRQANETDDNSSGDSKKTRKEERKQRRLERKEERKKRRQEKKEKRKQEREERKRNRGKPKENKETEPEENKETDPEKEKEPEQNE